MLELNSAYLDPDSIKDDDRFPIGFKIQLHCTVFPQPTIEQRDPHYTFVTENQQKEEDDWKNIAKILNVKKSLKEFALNKYRNMKFLQKKKP